MLINNNIVAVTIYQAESQFWRAKVNGVVHPLLVGLDSEETVYAKVWDMFPKAVFYEHRKITPYNPLTLEECCVLNTQFLTQLKSLALDLLQLRAQTDLPSYVYVDKNIHDLIPTTLVAGEGYVSGNTFPMVGRLTIDQILAMED